MSFIQNYITEKNSKGEKVLSVFLTSGFPAKNNFSELAVKILDAGADMLEVGFPFSDPLADGPVIQHSSQIALQNGVKLEDTFKYISEIRKSTDKPLIMMGYANPVLNYGIDNFAKSAKEAGANGVIIPDIPIEEYDNFFNESFNNLDTILLTTPTTSTERIKKIDAKSSGFVYCVSVSGTTGVRNDNKQNSIGFVKQTQAVIEKNKLLVGFGISGPEDAKQFSNYSDGVIIGSAIIKSIQNDDAEFSNTINFVEEIKVALQTN